MGLFWYMDNNKIGDFWVIGYDFLLSSISLFFNKVKEK